MSQEIQSSFFFSRFLLKFLKKESSGWPDESLTGDGRLPKAKPSGCRQVKLFTMWRPAGVASRL